MTENLEQDLDRLLRAESDTVEWKRSVSEWKDVVVSLAAMATLRGGRVCIGVEPTGEVRGVEIGKGTLEDVANKISQNTSPRLTPDICTV